MRTFKITVIALILGFTSQVFAGGFAYKERAGCIGPHQAWTFSWEFDPDDQLNYSALAKKGSSGSWTNQYTVSSGSYCRYVGMGLPLGSDTHWWKAQGNPSGITSNWVSYYLGSLCRQTP